MEMEMRRVLTDGNKITSEIASKFAEIAGAYPITPSTHMAEYFDELSSEGNKNIFGNKIQLKEMQSEAGAIACCHGALLSGKYATTFTSSQGLLLMIPEMYKIAGESLPMVMHVAARSLSTHALSIYNDHQDIYAVRQTGFFMICSETVQECYWNAIKSHLMAINYNIPVLHFFDGFNTSHKLESIEVLEDDELVELIKSMIDEKSVNDFRRSSILKTPQTVGTNQRVEYSKATELRRRYWEQCRNAYDMITNELDGLAKIETSPSYTKYGSENPKKLIVAMGSVCGTIKTLVDMYPDDLQLLKITQFRPVANYRFGLGNLKEGTEVYVIDRTIEFGANSPLTLDFTAELMKQMKEESGLTTDIRTLNIGLSSDDISISLLQDLLGLDDRPEPEIKSVFINGKGSEGLVTSIKWVAQVLHNQGYYVQALSTFSAYKSGGDTYSQLRVSKYPIVIQSDVTEPTKSYESKDFRPSIAENCGISGKLSAIAAYMIVNQFWAWFGFDHDKAVDDLTDIIKETFNEEIAQKNIDAINMYIEEITNERSVEPWL